MSSSFCLSNKRNLVFIDMLTIILAGPSSLALMGNSYTKNRIKYLSVVEDSFQTFSLIKVVSARALGENRRRFSFQNRIENDKNYDLKPAVDKRRPVFGH